MTNCKNCEMTDEYCASGDCPTSQSPRNDLTTKSQAIDLTEQWRKGELPKGVYYVIYYKNDTPEVDIYRQIFSLHNKPIKNFTINQVEQVIAPVPSYDEYMTMKDCVRKEFEAVEKYAELKETNEALKSELKEVCDVLMRKCLDMKDWVMMNWKNLYEVQDE